MGNDYYTENQYVHYAFQLQRYVQCLKVLESVCAANLFVRLFRQLPPRRGLCQAPVSLVHGAIPALCNLLLIAIGLERGPWAPGAFWAAECDSGEGDCGGGCGTVDLATQIELEKVGWGIHLEKAICQMDGSLYDIFREVLNEMLISSCNKVGV